ncbi:hypothetical protein [Dactylosporangium sp. CA-139066]|uniref:hypothetical protein n=1 Tax=Dactylosporangium sp. CA-139066 TaxID=3239930 RepID=UPI003D8D867A
MAFNCTGAAVQVRLVGDLHADAPPAARGTVETVLDAALGQVDVDIDGVTLLATAVMAMPHAAVRRSGGLQAYLWADGSAGGAA